MNNCISFLTNSARLLGYFPKNRERDDDKNMVFNGIDVLSQYARYCLERFWRIFGKG